MLGTAHSEATPLLGRSKEMSRVTSLLDDVATRGQAGRHENVAGLVYIAAFAPDAGESVNSLIAGFPAGGPQPPILPPIEGFLFLGREKFASSFAADLPVPDAASMADSQVPWAVEALNGTITEPAWRSKPS
jgi:hypothetical protein